MGLLQTSFFILRCCGFWRPVTWSGWKCHLYNIYTTFMIFVIYSVTVFQLIELIRSVNNVEEFTQNALILLTTTNACAKVGNILKNRCDILALVKTLKATPCIYKDETEKNIQNAFNYAVRKMSLMYALLSEISVGAVEVDSIMRDPPLRQLQFRTWLPYQCDTEFKYWITYIHQVFANTLGCFINISYDTLVSGCMLQTCGQFALFKHRMRSLQYVNNNNAKLNCENNEKINQQGEREIIADIVRHHLAIFELSNVILKTLISASRKELSLWIDLLTAAKCLSFRFSFAESSNNAFAQTIFIQYSASLIIICISVYQLTRVVPFTAEFVAVIVYLFCMLVQIFMFCFYGNMVMNESLNAGDDIYNIDWIHLTISTKKSLLMIMARTLRPISFTSGHIVLLTLNSFNGLLKLSYSAYNVLQQAS